MAKIYAVLFFCVCISLSVAAPVQDSQARIINFKSDNDGHGNYEFRFVTSNGIKRQEVGRLVNIGQPDEHIAVFGVYSYTDPEGKVVVVNYRADKDGYYVDGQPTATNTDIAEFTPDIPPPAGAPPALVASLLG